MSGSRERGQTSIGFNAVWRRQMQHTFLLATIVIGNSSFPAVVLGCVLLDEECFVVHDDCPTNTAWSDRSGPAVKACAAIRRSSGMSWVHTIFRRHQRARPCSLQGTALRDDACFGRARPISCRHDERRQPLE